NFEKSKFLEEFSSKYGYNGTINSIREIEYPKLKEVTYLDHSGSTIYSKSSVISYTNDLMNNLYSNPHSKNPCAQHTSHRVEQIRARVLRHFNANPGEYQVIFTQNATASIKLVGEMFPWTANQSGYKYLRESHNSLIGLRRFAEEINSPDIQAVIESDMKKLFSHKDLTNFNFMNRKTTEKSNEIIYNLFAYPAQCNFSGQRYPLTWSTQIKQLDTENSKILVLLDAAAYLTTSTLSLADKDVSPDFITMSFYKIFGLPTGLGALLIKSELKPLLRKRYFGGGTINAIAYDKQWQEFREDLSGRHEDGTINFLDIIALDHSFDVMERLYTNFGFVREHVTSLITYLSRKMISFHHWNDLPVCVIYSDRDFSDNTQQGPVLNFNVRRADGSWVGFNELEELASVNQIYISAGTHCNPGSMARWVNISGDESMANYKAGKICSDDKDIFNNKPTGSIRISLGAMSTIEDIIIWLDFFKKYFVEETPTNYITQNKNVVQNKSQIFLERLTLYPIKSCHGYTIPPSTSWTVTSQGLLYDREWMLVNSETGRALSQKVYPKMALIRPIVLRGKELLVITAPGQEPLHIRLNEFPNEIESSKCSSQVCGDNIQTLVYTSNHISQWFTEFLGITCRLARQPTSENSSVNRRFIKPHLLNVEPSTTAGSPLSLSNESPFLLVSQKSVKNVNRKIMDGANNHENERKEKDDGSKGIVVDCFRANLVINGNIEAYDEDQWKKVKIGGQVFKLIGPCRRCHMICIDHETGEKTKEPYSTLATYRRNKGRIYFGQHMIHLPELSTFPYEISSGCDVQILETLEHQQYNSDYACS
ncbi:15232_t:CDS:10, partial [Acaulospora morrowiae]